MIAPWHTDTVNIYFRLVTPHLRSEDIFLYSAPPGMPVMELRRIFRRKFRGPFFRRNFPRCHIEITQNGVSLNRRPRHLLVPGPRVVVIFHPREREVENFFRRMGVEHPLPLLRDHLRL